MDTLQERIQYGQYEVPTSDECVCLNVGQPRSERLPLEEFRYATNNVLLKQNPGILQYGKIQGYDKFRQNFANFLSEIYAGASVSPDSLIMTNGNTGGLQLLISLYAKNGTTIFVEDPTYFLALNSFKDAGLNIVPISIDSDGLNVDELEQKLKHENSFHRCLLYTIPIHQNPTGFTLSDNRRNKLVELANLYPNLLVIADEVYHMLSFEDDIQNIQNFVFPLCYYHKNFVSLGSFSKIFCPAIRLGWIQSHNSEIVNKIIGCGQLDSSGNVNPIGCAIANELITVENKYNLRMIIQKWKKFLSENCAMAYDVFTSVLAKHIENVDYPKGGYFLWVKFKPYVNTVHLSTIMDKYKVKFHHGNKFSSSGFAQQYMRLSFSWYDKMEDYIDFANRLNKLIEENTQHEQYVEYVSDSTLETIQIPKVNVFVLGYKGKLGSLIVQELGKSDTFIFKGEINRNMDLSNIDSASVIIDVSSPLGTGQLLTSLLSNKIYCPVVIGTTGMLPVDLIRQYGECAPIIVTSNFSKGITQLRKIIKVIDKNMWEPSLEEQHHIHKKDAPSGTAKLIAREYGISYDTIKSIREGEIIGEHTLTLSGPSETITISHSAKSRNLFAEGSLEWIKWISKVGRQNGVYEYMS